MSKLMKHIFSIVAALISFVVLIFVVNLLMLTFSGKHGYEELSNDFVVGHINSKAVETHHRWGGVYYQGWKNILANNMQADGYEIDASQHFPVYPEYQDRFDPSYVNNLFSSTRNIWQDGSANARVHQAVTILEDMDASLLSVFADGGYLKEPSDIYEQLEITGPNPDINRTLYDAALQNVSMEVNGQKIQVGIPHAFQLTGVTFQDGIDKIIDDNYLAGIFDHLTFNNVSISNIITSLNPFENISNYISANGWSWNEMMELHNALKEVHEDGDQFRVLWDTDELGSFGGIRSDSFSIENFLSAKRVDEANNILWNGISDNWNSDIVIEFANMNSITEIEATEAITTIMELGSWVKNIHADDDSAMLVIDNNSTLYDNEQALLPMPLFTNSGNDIYDDLVLTSSSLYVPDDSQFFSSEKGVNLRDEFLELFIKQFNNNEKIYLEEEYNLSPYTPTDQIKNNTGDGNAYTDELVEIMLSDTDNHSYSSTRWLGNWYRDTLTNSTKWIDTREGTYTFNFTPSDSIDREVNLYSKYNLNVQ